MVSRTGPFRIMTMTPSFNQSPLQLGLFLERNRLSSADALLRRDIFPFAHTHTASVHKWCAVRIGDPPAIAFGAFFRRVPFVLFCLFAVRQVNVVQVAHH